MRKLSFKETMNQQYKDFACFALVIASQAKQCALREKPIAVGNYQSR